MDDTSTNAQSWNFNFNIDLGDAARGKRKGDDKSQKIHLISGLTGTSTRSWNGPCNVCVKNYIVAYLKKKKKNWSPSLKFTNRIVLTQQQSWESTYLSWRRACKEVKSAIHLSCTRFHVVIRKRSIPCLRGTRSSSTSNGKWKFYPQRRTKEIGIWRHRAR